MKRKKILIIMFQIPKAQEHEWFARQIDRSLFDIEFAMINSKGSYLDQYLCELQYTVHYFYYKGKRSLLSLIWALWRLMLKNRYDIIHTHLFEANLAGLTAGFLAGVPRRIMTRHSGDYHHVYFPRAVKYDKLCNRLATDIVAVSQSIKNILINLEGADSKKITLIHHGIKLDDYLKPEQLEERIGTLRTKYQIYGRYPIVGVISRFIEWKGVQYVIPAFEKVLKEFPDALLILANASGSYENQIKKVLKTLPKESYRLIDFENDISALYRMFHCFVHVPVSTTAEAFGQTYIECMAAGIPMVITASGVANEFAKNEENCLLVPYRNSGAIAESVIRLMHDEALCGQLVNNGIKIVTEKFSNDIKIAKLTQLYLR